MSHPAELPLREIQALVDTHYMRHVPIKRMWIQNPTDGTGPGRELVRISMALDGAFLDADGHGATVSDAAVDLMMHIDDGAHRCAYQAVRPEPRTVIERLGRLVPGRRRG